MAPSKGLISDIVIIIFPFFLIPSRYEQGKVSPINMKSEKMLIVAFKRVVALEFPSWRSG